MEKNIIDIARQMQVAARSHYSGEAHTPEDAMTRLQADYAENHARPTAQRAACGECPE